MAIIDKPSDYFNTVLYTGNSSTQSITGVEFQPDFTWIKARNQAYNHFLFDAVRGVQKRIKTNSTDAESTVTGLTSFDTDGFGLGSNVDMNGSGVNFASWNWKAGGTASSNTDGSITSSVSANQDAGFSIVSYTGTETNATVGHGLGSAPRMILFKRYGTTGNWGVYHESLGNTKGLFLNTTDAESTESTYWNNTSPTSSVFSLGGSSLGNKSTSMIAYCFAEKQGYSKFGSYTGNGSTDGTFVYTGFKPAFVIFKRSSGTGNWQLLDNKRLGYNVENRTIYPNSSIAEQDEDDADLLSNGFKLRGSGTDGNGSGSTYIYMAFAENPFVTSTGVPACAR